MTTAEIAEVLTEYGFGPESTVAGDPSDHWRVSYQDEVFRVSFDDIMWVLYRGYERIDYGYDHEKLAQKLKHPGLDAYVGKADEEASSTRR